MKKFISKPLAALMLCGIFSSVALPAAAAVDIQVFVNGTRMGNTVVKDDKVYVQLSELAGLTGYEIEYNNLNKTVNYYSSGSEAPEIVRQSSLFPTQISEYDYDNGSKEIIKIYELDSADDPLEISRDDFEQNGYYYTLTDITKSGTEGVDTKEHTETVTVDTPTQNANDILQYLQEEMQYTSEDGYNGVLKLNMESISTEVAGRSSSSYTVSETRTYPGLSAPDTSLIPKSITVSGRTLSLASVNWQTATANPVDYTQVAETYTAVASYTGTATKTSVTGYTTTAEYTGNISKTIQGKTVYTAYFLGTPIYVEPEVVPDPTVEELEAQLAEAKAREKAENGGGSFDSVLSAVIVVGAIVALFAIIIAAVMLLGRNVTVYALLGDTFQKIGKTRVSKSRPIIDLSSFTDRVTTASFQLAIGSFTAKGLDGETLTINYGDRSMAHIVSLPPEKVKEYRFDIYF